MDETTCPACGCRKYDTVYARNAFNFQIGPAEHAQRFVRFPSRKCAECDTQYAGPESQAALQEVAIRVGEDAEAKSWQDAARCIVRFRNLGRFEGVMAGMVIANVIWAIAYRNPAVLVQPILIVAAWLVYLTMAGRRIKRQLAELRATEQEQQDRMIDQLFAGAVAEETKG